MRGFRVDHVCCSGFLLYVSRHGIYLFWRRLELQFDFSITMCPFYQKLFEKSPFPVRGMKRSRQGTDTESEAEAGKGESPESSVTLGRKRVVERNIITFLKKLWCTTRSITLNRQTVGVFLSSCVPSFTGGRRVFELSLMNETS